MASDAQGLERSEVYRLIDGERAYQDVKWGTVEQNPHSIAEWIAIAREELDESEAEFMGAVRRGETNRDNALSELRQVAAVCITALEQYGCPPREGYDATPPATLSPTLSAQTVAVLKEAMSEYYERTGYQYWPTLDAASEELDRIYGGKP